MDKIFKAYLYAIGAMHEVDQLTAEDSRYTGNEEVKMQIDATIGLIRELMDVHSELTDDEIHLNEVDAEMVHEAIEAIYPQ